jgi:hypothetical protein
MLSKPARDSSRPPRLRAPRSLPKEAAGSRPMERSRASLIREGLQVPGQQKVQEVISRVRSPWSSTFWRRNQTYCGCTHGALGRDLLGAGSTGLHPEASPASRVMGTAKLLGTSAGRTTLTVGRAKRVSDCVKCSLITCILCCPWVPEYGDFEGLRSPGVGTWASAASLVTEDRA